MGGGGGETRSEKGYEEVCVCCIRPLPPTHLSLHSPVIQRGFNGSIALQRCHVRPALSLFVRVSFGGGLDTERKRRRLSGKKNSEKNREKNREEIKYIIMA